MPRLVLIVAAAWGLLLVSAAPALGAHPYPLNFHTFDLSAGTPSGVAYSKGALTLSGKSLASKPYADPFANFAGDGVDGSAAYQFGTWTSPILPLSCSILAGFESDLHRYRPEESLLGGSKNEDAPLVEDAQTQRARPSG